MADEPQRIPAMACPKCGSTHVVPFPGNGLRCVACGWTEPSVDERRRTVATAPSKERP